MPALRRKDGGGVGTQEIGPCHKWGSTLPRIRCVGDCFVHVTHHTIQPVEERFRNRLQREFDQRRQANERYSLRAFAAFLGTDHSTLSQILRSQRPLPLTRMRSWAKKLGLDSETTAAYVA